jgi:Zn-finger nucleic acid-binding protein
MDCPVCKKEMIILELNQIEIDYCTLCDGIWLDEGELELLLENEAAKQKLLDTFKHDQLNPEKPRRCPRCRKRMYKVYVGAHREVLVDKCRKEHGIWFDSGELHDVIRLGSLDPQNKVLSLLNDMFADKLKKKSKI